MKKTLSAILALIMVFSTVIVGISGAVSLRASADTADGTTDGENKIGTTANSILNQDGTKPLEDDDVRWGDVYGMDNQPFLLTEKDELYVLRTNGSADSNRDTYLYDDIKSTIYLKNSDGSFMYTPNSSNNNPTSGTISNYDCGSNGYRFVKGVGFDPTGTGRNKYAAYVGVVNVSGQSSQYQVHCFVVEPTTGNSWDILIGEADWISNYSSSCDVMGNFMAITAGDYDGDHKDTAIVYLPGDNGDYKLYEVSFSGSALTKTQIFDLSTVIENDFDKTSTNDKYKPIVSLTTGDFDDDQTEEFAYSVGFDNTSDDAADGWEDWHACTSMNYYATAVGVGDYGSGWKYPTPVRLYDIGTEESLDGSTAVYPFTVIQGGAISAGDLDGEGGDEIVLVGYMSNSVKGQFTVSGTTKTLTHVKNIGDVTAANLSTSVISYSGTSISRTNISTISTNEFKSTSMNKWKDSWYVYPQICVECVATNGSNQAEDVFIDGTFYTYKEGVATAGTTIRLATQHFDTILGDSTKTSCYWFGNAAVGTFDHNDAGREQIYFSVWFKNSGSENYNAYIGIAGGGSYSDTTDSSGKITSYGSVSEYGYSDVRGDYGTYFNDGNGSKAIKQTQGAWDNLVPVAVDTDNDGIMAKHNSTRYAYSDPEVVAVLQASPTFSKIDELGGYDSDGNTEYSLTTTYEKSTTTGDTVSFGVGASAEVTAGIMKVSAQAGYSLDWDHEIEKSYGTEYTTTWTGGSEDQVCMTRTPIIIYVYDVQNADGTWTNCETLEVTAPLKPRQYSLSISEYNSFVDQYNATIGSTAFNKITTADMPTYTTTTVGGTTTAVSTNDNPYSYFRDASKAAASGTTASKISNTSYQLGYAGGSMGSSLSTSASTSESTTFTHGFSFSMSLQFGKSLGDDLEFFAGGYLDLSYGDIYGKSTTSGNSDEISGSVANISKSKLAYTMTSAQVEQYAFTWDFGKWERALATDSTAQKVPFYGYFVYDITSPVDPPTDLTAAYTSTDETTNVQLSWTAPESVTNGPKVVGYFIFDNGEAVNTNMLANTSTGTITYLHTGIGYGTKHSYTVRVVSEIDSKRYTSVDSNEADIGWVTTGNIISSIYKDDTYTSTDGLTDRYVIKMSNDDVYYFYVTNGKDGTNGTNGADGKDGADGTNGTDGINGVDGKTAYEVAVANGYTGTQQEWLDLIGASCASGHSYTEYSINPTCTSEGITVKVCSLCGFATAETAAATGHDYEDSTYDPSCINDGFTVHTCKTCNNTYFTDYTPALGHDYKAEVTAPTCSQKGYTTYTCQREGCGESKIADITDCVDHSFKDKVISNTCISDGYTIHYCENCGYQEIIDEKDASGHSYKAVQTIEPTCTSKGYTIYTCSDCGATYIGDEKDFAAHVPGSWVCENAETGHYVKTCVNCGTVVEETTVAGTGSGSDGSAAIKQGDTVTLDYGKSLNAGKSDGSNVTYTSSDESVAVVDENGVVTAKNSGTATITVTDNDTGISTSFNVNVKMTWWQRVHKVLSALIVCRTIFEIFNITY